MTKRAASMKAVKSQQVEDLPTLEETFENAKQAFLNTIEVSITIAKRVDNLLNIRDYTIGFWKQENGMLNSMIPAEKLEYYKELQKISIAVYEDLYKATKEFELEEFLKDEMKDYYEHIIPKVEEIETEEDLCEAGLIFLTVKPFGEKMTSLHHTMLDEKKQREFVEK